MEIKLPQNIKALRHDNNLTQGQLAEKLGTTQRKVSYWENGTVEPDIRSLWQLANTFEVSIDELIGRTEL